MMKKNKISILLGIIMPSTLLMQCTSVSPKTEQQAVSNHYFNYPITRKMENNINELDKNDFDNGKEIGLKLPLSMLRKDNGVDIYSDTIVKDPYRWLEDVDKIDAYWRDETTEDRKRTYTGTQLETKDELTSKLERVQPEPTSEVTKWVEEQNHFTRNYLRSIPIYDQIAQDFNHLFNYKYEYRNTTTDSGEFISRRDKGDSSDRVYRKDKNGKEILILDENALSTDHSIQIIDTYLNNKGNYLAYITRKNNSDTDGYTLYVLDTQSAKVIETISYVNGKDIYWKDDNHFYYSKITPNGWEELKLHKIGRSEVFDDLVIKASDVDSGSFKPYFSNDNKYLVVEGNSGALYLKDLNTDHLIQIHDSAKMFEKTKKIYSNHIGAKLIDIENDDVYFITTDNSEFGELVKVNIHHPNGKREIIIPAQENKMLVDAVYSKGTFFVNYYTDTNNRIQQFDKSGKMLRDITPDTGLISDLYANNDDKDPYVSFRFFNTITPRTDYTYRPLQHKFSEIKRFDKIAIDPKNYETHLVFYPSKDGTKIPMTISYKKGLKLNGKNPTLLYGYGGFNSGISNSFSIMKIEWMNRGGIYASANLRGGNEYGNKWHDAGQGFNKLNVFNDFIAAGNYLVEKGYTSHDYLAISGASNGGLLVGATMTIDPTLAKVAFPAVGVLDMLRHDKFATDGWPEEYGSANDGKKTFEFLKSYSPYHNVKKGVCYPSTLITTSHRDDRVNPSHSYKFAAVLQEKQSCANPILLFTAQKHGHSMNTREEYKEEWTDQIAFALYQMGIKTLPKK